MFHLIHIHMWHDSIETAESCHTSVTWLIHIWHDSIETHLLNPAAIVEFLRSAREQILEASVNAWLNPPPHICSCSYFIKKLFYYFINSPRNISRHLCALFLWKVNSWVSTKTKACNSDREMCRCYHYGVATISRLLKIIGLFYRISSLL